MVFTTLAVQAIMKESPHIPVIDEVWRKAVCLNCVAPRENPVPKGDKYMRYSTNRIAHGKMRVAKFEGNFFVKYRSR